MKLANRGRKVECKFNFRNVIIKHEEMSPFNKVLRAACLKFVTR